MPERLLDNSILPCNACGCCGTCVWALFDEDANDSLLGDFPSHSFHVVGNSYSQRSVRVSSCIRCPDAHTMFVPCQNIWAAMTPSQNGLLLNFFDWQVDRFIIIDARVVPHPMFILAFLVVKAATPCSLPPRARIIRCWTKGHLLPVILGWPHACFRSAVYRCTPSLIQRLLLRRNCSSPLWPSLHFLG